MQLVHGGDIAGSRRRYPGVEFLDFSANVNPLGMPGAVREAFLQSLHSCESYPDPLCRDLTAAISAFEGVDAARILCGGGAADLIFRAAYALRPKRALVLAPSFAEYELALVQVGCEVHRHTLREEEDFLPDSTLPEALDGMDMVVLCNPNNPTGALIPPGLLERTAEACAAQGIPLLMDECFLDFMQEPSIHSLKRRLHGSAPLIVLKAFTKLFAMPGLRLGYALFSNTAVLEACARAGPPWNVSAPAQLCGVAAAGESLYLRETRECIPVWREALAQELVGCGCKVYVSAANYLFFSHPRTDLHAELERRGLLIRDCGNYRGLRPGFYRVAVKTPEENAALIKAIKELLVPCQT